MSGIERLQALAVDTMLAGLDMDAERGRFAALAARHENGTAPRVVSSFNLFQTPPAIAAQMAAMIPGEAVRILEPSAGLGRLYLAGLGLGKGSEWVLVDESADCIRELYRLTEPGRGVLLKEADFLGVSMTDLGGAFDAVIMNPPFERGRDVKHIRHAFDILRPGGVLVSLCYNGAIQNRELRPVADSWDVLPAGSFRSEGTGAEVVMLTMKK